MDSTVEEIYTRYIKSLPVGDRLRLLELTARDLAAAGAPLKHSLLDLEGIGAEIWQGIDAQTYVNGIRSEWDHPHEN